MSRLSVVVGCARVAALAALSSVVAHPALATDRASPQFQPPKSYYLALGDSIAYGYQSHKHAAGLPPAGFDTGYVDGFAHRLRELRRDVIVVNYGCAGESTTTLIAGPCPSNAFGLALHDGFAGSQLDAATTFLAAHPGQVSPITLNVVGADVQEFVAGCAGDPDPDCISNRAPAALAAYGSRLALILDRLRAAAPNAELIVNGDWNSNPEIDAEAERLFGALNEVIAAAAREYAFFADMAPVFNPGGEEARRNAVCALTLVCDAGDTHPSDAGYLAMAEAVYDTSLYARLEE
jgi:lysophospholipase L1-like esterase